MATPVTTAPVTVGPIELPPRAEAGRYTRAQLEFREVDHSGRSMDVRVYLDRTDANADTPLDDPSFAGRFHIFGHGGCAGDLGHCELPAERDPFDFRLPHPLTPISVIVVITEALNRVLDAGATEFSVTAVPIVHDYGLPLGRDAKTELEFRSVSLVTY
jgi:hypothetical protein